MRGLLLWPGLVVADAGALADGAMLTVGGLEASIENLVVPNTILSDARHYQPAGFVAGITPSVSSSRLSGVRRDHKFHHLGFPLGVVRSLSNAKPGASAINSIADDTGFQMLGAEFEKDGIFRK